MASTVTLLKRRTMVRMSEVAAVASPTSTMMKSLLLEGSKGNDAGGDAGKRCCEHKHELVGYDALPEFLKHNKFVLDYYRSEWPIKQALLSVFALHNETINVWT
jgi:adiponectin receptor